MPNSCYTFEIFEPEFASFGIFLMQDESHGPTNLSEFGEAPETTNSRQSSCQIPTHFVSEYDRIPETIRPGLSA